MAMTATQAQALHSPLNAHPLIFAETGDTFTVVAVFYRNYRPTTPATPATTRVN